MKKTEKKATLQEKKSNERGRQTQPGTPERTGNKTVNDEKGNRKKTKLKEKRSTRKETMNASRDSTKKRKENKVE